MRDMEEMIENNKKEEKNVSIHTQHTHNSAPHMITNNVKLHKHT